MAETRQKGEEGGREGVGTLVVSLFFRRAQCALWAVSVLG